MSQGSVRQLPGQALPDQDSSKGTIDDNTELFVPCSEEDKGAIKMTLEDIDPDKLQCPKVTKEDIIKVIKRSKSTVDPEVEEKIKEYTRDFGPL